ncbi:Protein ERGIC-53-like [Golovinomyces cichoracearum]|uniref:Protein ERGIC-53-like n=1 Tax=Golovinomyces cichoracearum TaxID=62708 RepID=A0A420J309_9PEZI|nr:Protein ERGIC-53-like [Golovinomyces cichoracearum]
MRILDLLATFIFVLANASKFIDELSLGRNDKIQSENGAIAHFHLIGLPEPPEVLSNKIILTPPAPGNSRGALWSDKNLSNTHWNVDLEIRATGPERAGGNIQIWYVKNGRQDIGTSSIYTVGKFDGLALAIDQYAGSGGSIRGFLNDGSVIYKSHHNVDSLAFGHCKYSYRNLGRSSRISISHNIGGLRVMVDGKACFSSDKIRLPPGNTLGITAVSAEIPDSIELFKVVTTVDTTPGEIISEEQKSSQETSKVEIKEPDSSSTSREKSTFTSQNSAEQFADLSIRLQSIMKQVNRIHQTLATHQSQYIAKQDEVSEKLKLVNARINNVDLVSEHILEVKRDVKYMKEELHKSLEEHVQSLRGDVKETHDTVLNTHFSLHDRMSGLGSFTKYAILTLSGQVIVIAGYIMYKRRNKNTSKKFI